MNDKIKLLELANNKIASNEEFMAYYLAKYIEIEDLSINAMIEILECNIESFYKLGLCKAPIVADTNYLAELNKISDYIGISPMPLNKVIKRVSTVSKLRIGTANSYLMAARDKNKKSNDQDDVK